MRFFSTTGTTISAAPAANLGRAAVGWVLARRLLSARYTPHLLVAAVIFLFGIPTIILPFWPDQSIFSIIGKAIAQGGFPYTDAWDQKPPGIYLIYAAAIQGPFGLVTNVHL